MSLCTWLSVSVLQRLTVSSEKDLACFLPIFLRIVSEIAFIFFPSPADLFGSELSHSSGSCVQKVVLVHRKQCTSNENIYYFQTCCKQSCGVSVFIWGMITYSSIYYICKWNLFMSTHVFPASSIFFVHLLHKLKVKCITSCATKGFFPRWNAPCPIYVNVLALGITLQNISISAAHTICQCFKQLLYTSTCYVISIYVYQPPRLFSLLYQHLLSSCMWNEVKTKHIYKPLLFHSPLAWPVASDVWDPRTCRSWWSAVGGDSENKDKGCHEDNWFSLCSNQNYIVHQSLSQLQDS